MGARAHLLPVLVDGRAANQRVSISFVVGAEHAAEATERGAWKDAGKRVGLTAILRTALVGERERRSERGRRRWLLQSADLLRAVGIRTAARSKRQHCSGRHPSHLEALPQPHRQLGRRAPDTRTSPRIWQPDRRELQRGESDGQLKQPHTTNSIISMFGGMLTPSDLALPLFPGVWKCQSVTC